MSDLEPSNETFEENSGNFYTGTEPFLAVFTQTQIVLSGIRLIHDGKITHQVSDLGAQVENVRRDFIHSGDILKVLQEVGRIVSSYGQRVSGWEAEANRRLKAKSTLSGGALAKMKTEQSNVRTKIRLGTRSLTKLEVELHQLAGALAAEKEKDETGATSELIVEEVEVDASEPALTEEQAAELETKTLKSAEVVDRFLKQVIGQSLVVTLENANRTSAVENHVEQVWESHDSELRLPFVFAAGWTTKEPNPDLSKPGRKKLDLSFWVIPKSLAASETLELLNGRNGVWVESRKLDSTHVRFQVAQDSDSPRSDLLIGFLAKFRQKYDTVPNLLVATLGNLEWIQKEVLVQYSEA